MASSPTAPHHPESAFAAAAASAAAAAPNNLGILGCRNVSWALPLTRSAAFLPSHSSSSTSTCSGGGGGGGEGAAAPFAPPPPIDRPESVPPPERTVSGYCRFLFGTADVVVDAEGNDDDDNGGGGGCGGGARASHHQQQQQQQPSPSAPAPPTSIPLPLPIITNNFKTTMRMAAAVTTAITSIKRARSLGLGGVIPSSVDLTAVAAGGALDADSAAAPVASSSPHGDCLAPLPLPLPLPIVPPVKAAKCFDEATAATAGAATTTMLTTQTPSPQPPPPWFPPPRTTRARSAAASRTTEAAAPAAAAPPLFSFGGPFSEIAASPLDASRSFPPAPPRSFSGRKHKEEEDTFRLAMAIQASSNPRVVTTGLSVV